MIIELNDPIEYIRTPIVTKYTTEYTDIPKLRFIQKIIGDGYVQYRRDIKFDIIR